MTGHDPGDRGDAEGRTAFRAFVRAHHPDVGGDPAEFAAGLARFRAAGAAGVPGGSAPLRADRAGGTSFRAGRHGDRAAATSARPTESEVDSRYDAPVTFVVNRRGIAAVLARFRRRRRPPRVL